MASDLSSAQCGLLELLRRAGVRFLVIGGHALRAHGVNRPTKDLDIWVAHSKQDAKRLAQALNRLGKPPHGGRWEDAVGKPNVRLAYPSVGPAHEGDLLTSVGNLDFDSLYERGVEIELCGNRFLMPSRNDLIAVKKVSAEVGNDEKKKAQDKADIEALAAAQ